MLGPLASIVSSSLAGHHPCHKNILWWPSINTRPDKKTQYKWFSKCNINVYFKFSSCPLLESTICATKLSNLSQFQKIFDTTWNVFNQKISTFAIIVCTVHPPLLLLAGLNLLPNVKKRELDRTSVFRGGFLGKMGWRFSGSCNFYIKNKLKSGIFNDKFINKNVLLYHN